MGTLKVDVTFKNIHESARRQTLSLRVETGATYTTLPRTVVESLGCSPIGTRRVLLSVDPVAKRLVPVRSYLT
jgi:predicted aspartyl protease